MRIISREMAETMHMSVDMGKVKLDSRVMQVFWQQWLLTRMLKCWVIFTAFSIAYVKFLAYCLTVFCFIYSCLICSSSLDIVPSVFCQFLAILHFAYSIVYIPIWDLLASSMTSRSLANSTLVRWYCSGSLRAVIRINSTTALMSLGMEHIWSDYCKAIIKVKE